MLSLLVPVAAAVLLYYALRSVYRLLFHPLARIPGPKLAALSTIYETYFDLLAAPGDGGRFYWQIERLHARHGPIVRIGPNEVHVDDPSWYEVWKPISGVRDKPAGRGNNSTHKGTFGALDHYVHRPRKATLAPFFSRRNVAAHQAVLRTQADHLADLLQQNLATGVVVRMDVVYLAFALDIITEMVMGFSENVLQDPDKALAWKHSMDSLFEAFPITVNFAWLEGLLAILPLAVMDRLSPAFALVLRLHERIRDMGLAAIKEQQALEAQRPKEKAHSKNKSQSTIFQAILESDLPAHEKDLERLEHEGQEVIGAGSETSARILTLATYHVLTTPGLQQRLQAEIRAEIRAETAQSSVQVDVNKLESLPLLRAALKETLRLHSLVTGRMPLIAPTETLEFQGYQLPPGTITSMDSHVTMRDATIFPEPDVFRPERWLAADTKRVDRAFAAFGRGSRMCSGMNLAWAEMTLGFATIFGRFELELYDMDYGRDLKWKRDNLLGLPSRESKGLRVKVVKEL